MKKQNIPHQFTINFRYALVGSFTYETLKTIHNLFLLNLLDNQIYGKFGSITAIIFMLYRFTELGLTTTLSPYLNNFLQSKQSFKQLLLNFYLIIHLPLQIIAILLLPYFSSKFLTLNPNSLLFALITILVILETFRSFFRILLHATFNSKSTVAAELTGMLIYLGGIWIPILLFNYQPKITSLFIPFLADTIVSLSLLIWLTKKNIYDNLPETTNQPQPQKLKLRILKSRIINQILKISREVFSSNFLTPFFALRFGLAQAGIFYFASSLSYSLHAIFRGALTYPGTALLAANKNNSQHEKKEAFSLLCCKLMLFIAPIIIFLLINSPHLIKMGKSYNITESVISIASIFLVITLSDFFFILYEQLYIVEEASDRFLGFKSIEFLLFYFLVFKVGQPSIVYTLINIILIKLLCFVIIASDAYFRWRVVPTIKTSYKNLLIIFGASILSFIIFSVIV